MAVPLLDLRAQYREIRSEVEAALAGVIEEQRFILGAAVSAFEQEFAGALGVEHAVGCASGTDALWLVMRALALEPGDEVVVPAFTFFATAGAVWNAGLRPVFADVDPGTYTLTAETVSAVLTSRTRAVVAVHLFGQMAEMEPLLELARERKLRVVEDAAQAFGARQRIRGDWRWAGTVGDAGCFSFFPSKVLGGFGDGGMVAASDVRLAERIRKLRVHGETSPYHHELVGTNSRLDALQAAVLRVKLTRAPAWLARRRAVAQRYDEELRDLAPAVRTPVVRTGNESACNVYTIRVERRDDLKRSLDGAGVGNAIYYPVPLHLQPCFMELGYRPGDLPASEDAARHVLSLPIFPEMSAGQIEEVVEAVRRFHA